MLIILGVFVLLIVVIVVLALVLPRGGGGGAPVAEKTAEPKAVSPQATSLPGAPTAIPPTQPAAVPPTQVVQALVTPVPTPVPVPTQARPGGVEPTVAGVGGGEQALPATASGLGTWLVIIPVGVVLLGVWPGGAGGARAYPADVVCAPGALSFRLAAGSPFCWP